MPDQTVTVTGVQPPTSPISISFNYEAALSPPLPLPGSALTLRIRQDSAGAAWVVNASAAPLPDLPAIVARLEGAGEDTMELLFGVAPVEPYKTWKALWASNKPLPYRLGAVLLAMAARTDEIRKGGG